jgi:hypothetical protein
VQTDLLTTKAATISPCGRYRSHLSRMWSPVRDDPQKEHALFVMLNPSTADAEVDDPTIRRCVGFARAWGCTGVAVVNLFDWRATDPSELLSVLVSNTPLNSAYADETIASAMAQTHVVVAAWGALHPKLAYRASEVAAIAAKRDRTLHHLGLTKAGWPRHPLYLSGASELSVYQNPVQH